MKRTWIPLFMLGLVVLSALVYFIHFLVFRDPHHIFIFLAGDIAFVPIEVLLVTLILHRLLENRQKQAMVEKLNMLIGTFFSEVGLDLIRTLSSADPGRERLSVLVRSGAFSPGEFPALRRDLAAHDGHVDIAACDLARLKGLLADRRDFLMRLLENPHLLEHDTFTDLLWAVFHLAEELNLRPDITRLSRPDSRHIAADMDRAYGFLIQEWAVYMKHLKASYPYLFSLALRMNPFDPDAKPEVDN